MNDDSMNSPDNGNVIDDRDLESPGTAPGSSSSVMKLVAIAVGLTVVALLIVAVVFQQNLSDGGSRESTIIPSASPDQMAEYDNVAPGGQPTAVDPPAADVPDADVSDSDAPEAELLETDVESDI